MPDAAIGHNSFAKDQLALGMLADLPLGQAAISKVQDDLSIPAELRRA